MKELTKQMIEDFKIYELGYDFMAYPKQGKELINFHHLIVPRRLCQEDEKHGYYYWNGALLYETSHQYLHLINCYDKRIFEVITNEMIAMNVKGYLDNYNLKYIDECLCDFEDRFKYYKTNKGKSLIKPKYLNRIKID